MPDREMVIQFVLKFVVECKACGMQFVVQRINIQETMGQTFKFAFEEDHPNFCPYCGAPIGSDMDDVEFDDTMH